MSVRSIGGITIKDMYFAKAGEVRKGHCHTYDHCSMCIYGSARVETYKAVFTYPFDMHYEVISDVVYSAPQHVKNPNEVPWVNIKAGVRHQITALMDGTYFWCVYATPRTG